MNEETQKIFEDQLGILPGEVVSFLSSANWDAALNEIASLYNLSNDQLYGFKREATLVLVGLINPNEFGAALEKEVGIKGAVLEAVVKATEQKVFATVRQALVDFLGEDGVITEETKVTPKEEGILPKASIDEEPQKEILHVVPENLPVSEDADQLLPLVPFKLDEEDTEPLMPPIPPKNRSGENAENPTHPFEEKMQQVFTAQMEPLITPKIEPVVAPQTPSVYDNTIKPLTPHTDPYREPIE